MTIGIVVLAATALAWLVARPAGARSVARSQKRRERLVHRDPQRATSYDVRLILDQELTAEVAEETCRLATVRAVPPTLLWCWVEAHSATHLALALGAGYDRQELAQSVPSDIAIDAQSLQMHAELNGSLVGMLPAA